MAGFTIPNKAEAEYPRQAQPHQVDIDNLTQANAHNGVYKGCSIVIADGMSVELENWTEGGEAENAILFNLEIINIDILYERMMLQATPQYLTLSDGHATYPRFDLIWADPTGIHISEGSPQAIPIKPDHPTDEEGGVVLYEVYVQPNAVELIEANFTDKRSFVKQPREHWAWVPVNVDRTRFPGWD